MQNLREETRKVHNLKVEIQEAKLERGEKEEDVKAWSEDIEAKLAKFEQSVNKVQRLQTRSSAKRWKRKSKRN